MGPNPVIWARHTRAGGGWGRDGDDLRLLMKFPNDPDSIREMAICARRSGGHVTRCFALIGAGSSNSRYLPPSRHKREAARQKARLLVALKRESL